MNVSYPFKEQWKPDLGLFAPSGLNSARQLITFHCGFLQNSRLLGCDSTSLEGHENQEWTPQPLTIKALSQTTASHPNIQGPAKLCTFLTHRIHVSTYLLTYLLHGAVLLEKLTGLQLVKKFPAFHGTRRFITALTSVRHLALTCASPIQSTYPHPTSSSSIIILSTHLRLGLPSGLHVSTCIIIQRIHTVYFPNRLVFVIANQFI